MENEYGITVANKYALFLNEDEDSLEILKLQPAKKSDKTKKNASKEKEVKPSTAKQNGSPSAGQDKKAEKVDQFSAPTTNSEPAVKSAGVPVQGTAPATNSESHFESGRANRLQRDRAKPRSSGNRDARDQPGEPNKASSEPFQDNRPPRIRARGDRRPGGYPRPERRGFGENRQFRSENESVNENAEKPTSVSHVERREHRPPRNGFSDHSARPENDRFSVEASEQSGGRGDRADRDGFGGRGYSRRGGYGYRGPIRTDRNQFSERGDQDRTPARFEDNQGRHQEERQARQGFNDNDGGNFMERSDREGFAPRRDSRGRRGGFGRGRGGFDRPPRRDYQRYGDSRRQRSQEAEGEAPSDDNKLASADEPKLQQQHDKLHEGGGSSWAEQIDAADQEAKKDNSNLDEEAGGDANEAGEEADVMTLDEWKAREDNKRVKAEFNIRKPGEGYNTDPQWKKMYVLSKKERTEEHDEEDEQEEEHHFKARNVLPIEIHFADDSARGGRGRGIGGGRRGGMGGPRGRGGSGVGRWESDEFRGDSSRGQTRGGRGSYNESRTYVRGRGGAGGGRRERTPNFADESDFPSLGSNTQP